MLLHPKTLIANGAKEFIAAETRCLASGTRLLLSHTMDPRCLYSETTWTLRVLPSVETGTSRKHFAFLRFHSRFFLCGVAPSKNQDDFSFAWLPVDFHAIKRKRVNKGIDKKLQVRKKMRRHRGSDDSSFIIDKSYVKNDGALTPLWSPICEGSAVKVYRGGDPKCSSFAVKALESPTACKVEDLSAKSATLAAPLGYN